jgi:2-oxoglutarate dehydrogenase E2 component (dihydrolipoamide succinyltransferase)
MSAEITVPQLGESVVEATVGRWLRSEGDAVAVGDAVVELETDKVNVEVPSTVDGTLQSIVKSEGENVAIGDVLALVDENGAASQPDGRGSSAETTAGGAPAPQSQIDGATTRSQEQSVPSTQAVEIERTAAEDGRATPLARRIAEEHGLDLSLVKGTGPGGRIKRDDVSAYLRSPGTQTQSAPNFGSPPVATPQPLTTVPSERAAPTISLPSLDLGERREQRVRMSRRRQTIAQRLVEAQHTAAMLTTFNEIDMAGIVEIRKRRRDAFKERHGVGLGYMSFFTHAVVGALKAFPRLNAEIQGDEMILKYYYDIGIAVGTDEGLVVPVIRDADRLTFAEIERQVASLAEKARNRTLSLQELQGGTFTITNGGIYGSLMSTPILNAPQVGILGMHKTQERPVVMNGEVVVRPMMYVALSYDHRIVDGTEAVQFLVRVKELLKDPETLLLEA